MLVKLGIVVGVAVFGFLKNFFAVFTRARTYLYFAIKTAYANYAYIEIELLAVELPPVWKLKSNKQ